MLKIKKRPFISTPLFTVMGRAAGFFVPIVIAFRFGANKETDAFFFAYSLCIFFIYVFSHLFESTLIPFLAEFKNQPKAMYSIVSKVRRIVMPSFTIFYLLFFLFCGQFLMRTPSWGGEAVYWVQFFLVGLSFFVFFAIWVSSFHGLLYAQNFFWVPSISPLIRSVTVVLFIFFFYKALGFYSIAGGYFFGEILRWGVVAYLTSRLIPVLKNTEASTEQSMTSFWRQALLQIIALFAVHIQPSIHYWFAYSTGQGNLTLLNYADRLFQIPYQIFFIGVLQIFLTSWSDCYHQDKNMFWKKSMKDISRVFILGVFAVSIIWFSRGIFVEAFYGHSGLGFSQLTLLKNLLGWMGISFLPQIIMLMETRIFFITHRSHLFSLISWLQVLLVVIFDFWFVRIWGVQGIVVSMVVVYSTTALFVYLILMCQWRQRPKVGQT